MGLDMYLYADIYRGGYEHMKPSHRRNFEKVVDSAGLTGLVAEHSPHAHVRVCVAYWRKANAVHGWFVTNVAGGVDDCKVVEVSAEQLRELQAACKRVVEADDKAAVAKEVGLEPREGFFFGNTEMDSWYVEQLEQTARRLEVLLSHKALAGADGFYYRASW